MENKNLARKRKEIIAKAQFMQSGVTDSQIDPNQMQKKKLRLDISTISVNTIVFTVQDEIYY